MDLFQEFRKLILGDGLLKLIEDFRNPTFEDKLYFNAKYIPEKDAIHRSYFDEVRQANVETYTDFMPLLKKELLRIKQELRDHLSNAAAVHSETSELYKEAFDKSEVDFVIVRKKVAEEFTFSLYLNELQLFISDVESTYKSKLFSGTSSSSNPKKTLSFYFDGDVKILHKIYHELKFETGDFIDKEITTEKTFVDLLTSPDVLGQEGKIQFECESRQAAYVITKMQPLFKNFRLAAIEQSGKFFSSYGTAIKADSLSRYNSEYKDVKGKKAIDAFFKSLKKQ
jgi:hypothetical protein